MRRLLLPAILLLLATAAGGTARAGLILSIGEATISPRGTTTVDIFIASDTAETLDSFGLVLRLGVGPDARRLEIVPPPLNFSNLTAGDTDGQLVADDYLFREDSADRINMQLAGSVRSDGEENNLYEGGDGISTFGGTPVPVPSTPTLLTRLLITADTGNSPLPGDNFQLSLLLNDPGTFFYDSAFNDLTPASAPTGTISVVPEPPGLTYAMTAAAIAVIARTWRRRTSPLA